jgi:hypothetical protein
MTYPQDPNNPYGQPEQNPYGQGTPNPNPYAQPGQNPYGQPTQPQPGGLFDSGGGQPPFGQGAPNPNPYGQPGNPYDTNAAPTQIYGPGQNPYGQPGNPYDASGGQIPQQFGQQPPYGAPGYPQQQPFYGAQPPSKNNTGMIIGIVVAVVAVLGVGGYFLASGSNNPTPNPTVASLQSGQPTSQPSSGPSGSPAPSAGGNGAIGSFTPPSSYSSNALQDDPGCGTYAGGEADFLTSTFDLSTTSDANTAFDKLSSEISSAAGDADDPTLKAAMTAESGYIKSNEPVLSAGMVAYNSSDSLDDTQFSQAFAGDKATDEYINGVCGLASWSPTEP